MNMSRLESILSDRIEGFFNKHLAGDIEPSELGRELAREVSKQAAAKRKSVRDEDNAKDSFIANEYIISVNPTDYEKLCSQRVIALLTDVVRREIIKQDCFTENEPKVTLLKEPTLENGFHLRGCFSEAQKPDADSNESDDAATIVLPQKLTFKNPLNLPIEQQFVSLRVIEGADVGSYLEFGAKKIFIGRRDLNDFILTDDSVSRIHASVEYKNGRHFLRDEKSSNGTKIADERIFSQVCLKDGDEMKFGDTLVRYEVM